MARPTLGVMFPETYVDNNSHALPEMLTPRQVSLPTQVTVYVHDPPTL
jgi:hypothetical protein